MRIQGGEDGGKGLEGFQVHGVVLVGDEDVHRGEAPCSVIAAELSMNDQNLVEELRGALERSVQVPAVAVRQHVEVVAGCQDYQPPIRCRREACQPSGGCGSLRDEGGAQQGREGLVEQPSSGILRQEGGQGHQEAGVQLQQRRSRGCWLWRWQQYS